MRLSPKRGCPGDSGHFRLSREPFGVDKGEHAAICVAGRKYIGVYGLDLLIHRNGDNAQS